MLTLEEVLSAIGGKLINNTNKDIVFSSVTTNSKEAGQGMLFIPLIGERFDGHNFINDAAENGAAAALTKYNLKPDKSDFILIKVDDTLRALQDLAKYIRNKYNRVKVIAITGSAGKTTTKNFVTSVLREKYKVLCNEGNYNNQIGMPLTIMNMDGSYDIAVLEMGMNSFGEIRRLSEIARQDMAIITNIGTAHLGKLGSRVNILKAKLEITEHLNEGNVVYLNGDDDLLKNVKGAYQIKYFGCEENNDIKVFKLKDNKNGGMEFKIQYKGNVEKFNIRLPGRHNVLNALPAIAIGYDFGLNSEEISRGLLKTKNEKMRLKLFESSNMKIIDDTYNANPDSMIVAIDYLIDCITNRKVAILGDMLELDNYSERFHTEIGKYCYLNGIDILITYGTMAEYIAKGAVDSGMNEKNVYSFNDMGKLKENLPLILKSDDSILIKGSRAMKMDEIAEYLGEK